MAVKKPESYTTYSVAYSFIHSFHINSLGAHTHVHTQTCMHLEQRFFKKPGSYSTAQRQRRKRTQLFCDLRVRIECNECVLSMRTNLDFRIL